MSDRSAEDFIEVVLDASGDAPHVVGHTSRSRGRRVVESERAIGEPESLTAEDLLEFLAKELEAFVDSMIERKKRGEKIHTNEAILNYQKSLLRNEPVEWTCMAGYKLFFVSAQGKFWECRARSSPTLKMRLTKALTITATSET